MKIRIIGLDNALGIPSEVGEALIGLEFYCTFEESPETTNPVNYERLPSKLAYLIPKCTGWLDTLNAKSQVAYNWWYKHTNRGFCRGILIEPQFAEVL